VETPENFSGEPRKWIRYSLSTAIGCGCLSLVVGILGFVILASCFYTVGQDEEALVIRFGKFRSIEGPTKKLDAPVLEGTGFKLKAPFFVDRVLKVPVGRELERHYGFENGELLFIADDLKEVAVKWRTVFKIQDSRDYVFKNRNVDTVFGFINTSAVQNVVGNHNSILMTPENQQQFADKISKQIQLVCDQYELGVRVVRVNLEFTTK
jgi:membrane protease subunit HflK